MNLIDPKKKVKVQEHLYCKQFCFFPSLSTICQVIWAAVNLAREITQSAELTFLEVEQTNKHLCEM